MIYGGILAGGLGTRMSSSAIPKQFIEIASIPILVRTVKTILSIPEISRILITITPVWESHCITMLEKRLGEIDRIRVIHGGSTRFESLINLAKTCIELTEDRDENRAKRV